MRRRPMLLVGVLTAAAAISPADGRAATAIVAARSVAVGHGSSSSPSGPPSVGAGKRSGWGHEPVSSAPRARAETVHRSGPADSKRTMYEPAGTPPAVTTGPTKGVAWFQR